MRARRSEDAKGGLVKKQCKNFVYFASLSYRSLHWPQNNYRSQFQAPHLKLRKSSGRIEFFWPGRGDQPISQISGA